MANCLCFKDLVLVSESQSDNDYTRFMGGSSHILQFFGRLVECRQPWTNHLFMFMGRIYKPITFCTILLEETNHGLLLCSQVFFVCIVLFFLHFPTHALLSASLCFFLGGPTNGNFRNLWYHTQAYEQSFP